MPSSSSKLHPKEKSRPALERRTHHQGNGTQLPGKLQGLRGKVDLAAGSISGCEMEGKEEKWSSSSAILSPQASSSAASLNPRSTLMPMINEEGRMNTSDGGKNLLLFKGVSLQPSLLLAFLSSAAGLQVGAPAHCGLKRGHKRQGPMLV